MFAFDHQIILKVIKIFIPADLLEILAASSTDFPVLSFLSGSDSKESVCNAGDLGLIPGSRRSPGEGNDYPLQYSWLKNSMDRGAWRATVYEVAKSWTRLND